LAISALPPSAATISARVMSIWAPDGNSSNSRRAALIHEIGRVVGGTMNIGKYDNNVKCHA
jgi:hypothetical protein